MDASTKPAPGQIVKVLKGKDRDKFAVIVSIIDDRFVLVADGDKRKFDQAKKKNIAHLQLYDEFSSEVANSLRDTGRVTNRKLRYAVMKYMEKRQAEAQEKGD